MSDFNYLCFWLPVGRSVFGFENSADEPLAVHERAKEGIEKSIVMRVRDVVSKLAGYENLVVSSAHGETNDSYGRRYIRVEISKLFNHCSPRPTIYLFSNGLCAVQFKCIQEDNQTVAAEEIFEQVIAELFHLACKWQIISEKNSDRNCHYGYLDSYKGILTYAQFDIILSFPRNFVFQG